ncbi:MAG: T9SS type A sorting domain-containing protein [Saprospiraceae bacterium]
MLLRCFCLYTLFTVLSFPLFAQVEEELCCFYQLELTDAFGDGWNNASINLVTAGDNQNFTLTNIEDNGLNETFFIPVTDGDSISLTFNPGNFDFEISYELRDSEGNVVFADTPQPNPGLVYVDTVSCPSCPVLIDDYFNLADIKAVTAEIDLLECNPGSTYLVEYDVEGFAVGTGENVIEINNGGTEIVLPNLEEKTFYDVYVSLICPSGDTTNQIGPFNFESLYKVDVGIIDISTPNTDCELSNSETVTVTLANFGANPLSLIPFNYSVNGVEAGVPQPEDGYFTGVLGKDSTFTIEFETTYDFSVPDEYEILAWTELEEDSDVKNDTARFVITNIPRIMEYPYFTDFEIGKGGWTIGDDSANPSWEYGTPASNLIDGAASGIDAWVTNLTGEYNLNELSYLVSPCLDFADLEEDPILAFSLNFASEGCCDEGWVEVSKDGGLTYEKVGADSTGLNWYNDAENQWWDGNGGFDGWVSAVNTLTGTAGFSDVRVRFVMSSDFSNQLDGFAIDDVFISPPLDNDLAAVNVANLSQEECGQPNDTITITIANLGTETQMGFDVGYQVNGGAIVSENVGTLSVEPGEQVTYTFLQTFSSAELTTYFVEAFVNLGSDDFVANNTARFNFATSIPLPYLENFEVGALPSGWATPGEFFSVTDGHNAGSFVLFDNLWESDTLFEATSPVIGPVASTDSVTFDYRFVLFDGEGLIPKTLIEGDSLNVYVSVDCGETYDFVQSINSSNHSATNVFTQGVIPLANYGGESIKLRFEATWAAEDYFVDIDNIRIVQCPADLGLQTSIVNETANGEANGSATVSANSGFPPYSYDWSNGDDTKTATGLEAGLYRVVVTDAFGCSDFTEVTVDIGVATEEIEVLETIKIAPNPTNNMTQLSIEFSESVQLEMRVVSLVGQLIQQYSFEDVRKANYDINLSDYPSGIYFVQLLVNGQLRTEKIVKM